MGISVVSACGCMTMSPEFNDVDRAVAIDVRSLKCG